MPKTTEKIRVGSVPLPGTHPGQDEVLSSPARFKVMNCGRRWRKSTTAEIQLIKRAEEKPGLYWWVWPNFTVGETGWNMLRSTCFGFAEISEFRRRVVLGNGSEIWVKSADNEDSLRSAGLDGVAFAECREIRERVWSEIIRPALSDRKGWALFESTPRGHNWFYKLYCYAEAAPDWACWTKTTYDNPDIDPAEIDAARLVMSEAEFEQEYLAKFLAGAGVAFPEFSEDRHVIAPLELPAHWPALRGVDWGRESPFACAWIRIDPDTGRVYGVREAYETGMTDRQQARLILANTPPTEKVNITYADPSMWTKKTYENKTFSTADEYRAEGLPLTKADNNRAMRKRRYHTLLANLPDGKPGLQIFKTCPNFIRTLKELPVDPHNVEDVATDAEDHLYDAAGYVFVSIRARPNPVKVQTILVTDPLASKLGLAGSLVRSKDL
jgi:hypothetical protein